MCIKVPRCLRHSATSGGDAFCPGATLALCTERSLPSSLLFPSCRSASMLIGSSGAFEKGFCHQCSSAHATFTPGLRQPPYAGPAFACPSRSCSASISRPFSSRSFVAARSSTSFGNDSLGFYGRASVSSLSYPVYTSGCVIQAKSA